MFLPKDTYLIYAVVSNLNISTNSQNLTQSHSPVGGVEVIQLVN